MRYVESVPNIFHSKFAPYLILFVADLILDVSNGLSQSEINKHLELGNQFLARNQLQDALTHYHAAIEGDPKNFLTYFKRATVYLALGKAKLALSDLDKALDLKPDFIAARFNRGAVFLKLCDLEHAQLDFRSVLEVEPYHPEANDLYNKILEVQQSIDYAYSLIRSDNYHEAVQLLTTVLDICPWSSKMRKLRAQCHIENGDTLNAVSDMRSASRLETDSTEGYLELSKLLYQLGHASDSLKEIRECLKLDPEHRECFPFYKKIKKVEKLLTDAENYKQSQDYDSCESSALKALKLETEQPMIIFNAKQLLCTCTMKNDKGSDALNACSQALDLMKDANTYCDRAEAYISLEMYDDAIRDYHSAIEIDEHLSRAKEGLQRAQKMQHQSEKRDYYKILGVKRTASKKEIVKAYRKAAQKWHPDNFQNNEAEKKKAEKKFIDIAAAKEVLTNEEKRAQYDNGEDPLDPEQHNNFNGGNPFHHFHTGSPFQFRFHFN